MKAPVLSSAREIVAEMRRVGNPRVVPLLLKFYRTGPGEYGEGDRFLGLPVPVTRGIAKRAAGLTDREIALLLKSPFHEARLAGAVILTERSRRSRDEKEIERIAKFYWKNRRGINQWDLVDVSAPLVLGKWLVQGRARNPRAVKSWILKHGRSRNLWEKRLAVLASFGLIRAGFYSETLAVCALLLKDEHDLIHKATGWMLREIGNRSEADLDRFLREHAAVMPRTMLRYSIEKKTPRERAYWMKQKSLSK